MWMQWAKSVGLHYGGIDYSPEMVNIEGNVKYPPTLQTLEVRRANYTSSESILNFLTLDKN